MMKKSATPKPRATRRGTPVPMPTPSKRTSSRGVTPVPLPKKPGNIATGGKKSAAPRPTGKINKKPKKPITERQFLDVPNMTPAEKAAYLRRGKLGY